MTAPITTRELLTRLAVDDIIDQVRDHIQRQTDK